MDKHTEAPLSSNDVQKTYESLIKVESTEIINKEPQINTQPEIIDSYDIVRPARYLFDKKGLSEGIQYQNIPEQLQRLNRWQAFGRYIIHGFLGYPLNVSDGLTFKIAKGNIENNYDKNVHFLSRTMDSFQTLIFIRPREEGICCIEIKEAFKKIGQLVPHAKKIVELIDSYTEISKDGKSIFILFTINDFEWVKQLETQTVSSRFFNVCPDDSHVEITGYVYENYKYIKEFSKEQILLELLKDESARLFDDFIKRIPSEMRDMERWIIWGVDEDNAETPYNPKTMKPMNLENKRLSTLSAACERVYHNEASGIGFVLKDEGVCCIHLNDAFDDKGKMKPMHDNIVGKIASFSEIDLEGTGVNIWTFNTTFPGTKMLSENGLFQIHKDSRYIPITGRSASSSFYSESVYFTDELLNVFYNKYFEKSEADNNNIDKDDFEYYDPFDYEEEQKNKAFHRFRGARLHGNTSVNIDELSNYPNHPFKPYSFDKIEKLKESIRDNGLIHPILVMRGETNQNYYILSGHNRIRALKRLGCTNIQVLICDALPKETADIIVVESNLRQREKYIHLKKQRLIKCRWTL